MKDIKLWQFIAKQLRLKNPVIFLCVLESKGSSPGRQGFKMAVTTNEMYGSVGGGIMEHKFVELAKKMLRRHSGEGLVKQQVHSKSASVNQSGMICSGEQTLALYPVNKNDLSAIKKIVHALENNKPSAFGFSLDGFSFLGKSLQAKEIVFEKKSGGNFIYRQKLDYENHLHIIGGGHCSLALSRLMRSLDFKVCVYDERRELNTMKHNIYAHYKQLVNYEKIGDSIPEGTNQYVAIMTIGYRKDGIVLRQLMNKKFRYLGLLGSNAKVAEMMAELKKEGFKSSVIKAIHAPAGIFIKSETPEEIAVSIAAEIVKAKNYKNES
jgi:xanthine dehydrogenase accessory factor